MMPPLTFWALRLACAHLAVGLTVGALLLADKGFPFLAGSNWLDVHFHTMLFGWTIQFVMGVAYWILPTFGRRTNTGNDTLAWSAIALVNLGTLVGCFTGIFSAAAFTIQALAAMTFAAHTWPRLKAFGAKTKKKTKVKKVAKAK